MSVPTVMVVENDMLTRFILAEMCDELGFGCETAADGEQCIAMLRDRPDRVEIILMDIHLPMLSGDAVNARIRQMETDPPSGLPVFAVTSDPDWLDEQRCRDAGFDGVIAKPITISNLQATLDRVVQVQR